MNASRSVGGGIPSNVSKRWMSRSASRCLAIKAAAIELPPMYTPHSTNAPGIFARTTYRIASQSVKTASRKSTWLASPHRETDHRCLARCERDEGQAAGEHRCRERVPYEGATSSCHRSLGRATYGNRAHENRLFGRDQGPRRRRRQGW